MSSQLPPKLYFRIGEVAGLVGVEPHVLRYWEREFRSIRPTKSAKGQRVYSRRDVENLIKVKDLLYAQGFTIAGARKKLTRPEAESSPEIEAVAVVAPKVEASPEPVTEPSPSAFRSASAQTTLVELRAEIVALLGELG
jgi:DNA-binding transcriptional MerR regulator